MKNCMVDVFISHASKDKVKYVENLVLSIKSKGISVFYDTESISWGDCIKEKIDEGLANCRLAIIVISKNYFGRKWTEYELKTLLNRQNEEGKKLILPILYRISKKDFISHYPTLEDIKFIHSKSYRNSEIAELLLKKLK